MESYTHVDDDSDIMSLDRNLDIGEYPPKESPDSCRVGVYLDEGESKGMIRMSTSGYLREIYDQAHYCPITDLPLLHAQGEILTKKIIEDRLRGVTDNGGVLVQDGNTRIYQAAVHRTLGSSRQGRINFSSPAWESADHYVAYGSPVPDNAGDDDVIKFIENSEVTGVVNVSAYASMIDYIALMPLHQVVQIKAHLHKMYMPFIEKRLLGR